MRHRTAGAATVLLALAWTAGGETAGGGGKASATLGVPGRANAFVSAAAQDKFVSVVWAAATEGGATDVYAASSRDAGTTWTRPVRVNHSSGDARVSGEQPPRIALVKRAHGEPSIVVVWTSPRPGGTRLLTARSGDGGRTFGRESIVPGSEAAGNRGWESTVVDAAGHVDAIWLDHREMAHGRSDAPHEHGAADRSTHDGVAMAQQSKIYFASLDRAVEPKAITGGVCYCCKTAIATALDGSLYLAWRHVYAGNIRDIAFTRSSDGGRTFAEPIRVSEDRWVLDGCPENGPAIAVDASRRVHIVWPTLVPELTRGSEPSLTLFYATSRDGRQFTARQQIQTEGVPRHVQIAIGSAGSAPLVAWDEQVNGKRQVVFGRAAVDVQGTVRISREVANDDGPAQYPAVAPMSNGFIAAWTSGPSAASVIRIARLDK
jgi:hypothetical protein